MQDAFTTTKTKVGRTKPSTGPHAARGLDIAALDEGLILSTLVSSGHVLLIPIFFNDPVMDMI